MVIWLFLGLCSNLKTICFPSEYSLIKKDNEFLPKLDTIKSFVIRNNNIDQMNILTHKYHKSMKSLRITFTLQTIEELKTCLTQLSLFENLRSLQLQIKDYEEYNFIDQPLEELTRKCTKLTTCILEIGNDSLKSEYFLKVLSHLKAVQKLVLMFGVSKKLKGGVNYLKDCPKLQKIIISCSELTEEFFEGIQIYVPIIRSIIIYAHYRLSDQFFKSLSLMKYLQKVRMQWYEPIGGIEIFHYNKSLKIYEDNKRIELSQNKPNV